MRQELLTLIKSEIAEKLATHLKNEGISLLLAANDNLPAEAVILENIETAPLISTKLLTEIQVILRVLAKPWQSDALIEGIYQCLCPYRLTLPELTVLLMSLHVELHPRTRFSKRHTRATIRYIMEEEQA